MQTVTLNVLGMACGGCAKNVERTVASLSGVDSAKACLDAKTVCVVYNETALTVEEIQKAIVDAGFKIAG